MEDCLFCKIVNRQIPSEFLFEDDHCIIIKDKYPQAPTHLLVIPKNHIHSMAEATEYDFPLIGKCLYAGKKYLEKIGLGARGYRTVINTGTEGGQTIFHLHIHLIGGKILKEKNL